MDCRTDNLGSEYCQKKCDAKAIENDPECQIWCQNNGAYCDQIVSTYCKSNPSNTLFCGCYNFSRDVADTMDLASKSGQAIIPWCHIASCASSDKAYRSKVMRDSGKCPDQPLCLQTAAANNTAGNVSFKNLNFNCSASTNPFQQFIDEYFVFIQAGILCFIIMCSCSSMFAVV